MEKSQELVRLRIYEVYAWGVPIVITAVAAILDNLPETPNESFLRPRFGENKCWFYGESDSARKLAINSPLEHNSARFFLILRARSSQCLSALCN
jgi:hypothetical protein